MGLYLHIPFCARRCVYCDFYFVTTSRDDDAFTEALCAEISRCAERYDAPPLETIYFGGGTPSLLAPRHLARILDAVHARFDASAVEEVTLELNPDDVRLADLRALRALGIDRLSIGVQSFFEEDLRWMNRSHSAAEAARIVPMARAAGFDNFSVDLIFGLPEQPAERWTANLALARRLAVPHLSTYGLTIEPKTPLGNRVRRGLTTPASEEQVAARYQETMDTLRAGGYAHYEISSFARPGREARHNARYWQHADYLGLGPSAHSFRWESGGARRWANVRSLRRWQEALSEGRLPVTDDETLAPETLADEYVLLRLRTADGLDLDRLRTRYGRDLCAEQPDALARLEAEGYLCTTHRTVRLTDKGKLTADAVTAALLS